MCWWWSFDDFDTECSIWWPSRLWTVNSKSPVIAASRTNRSTRIVCGARCLPQALETRAVPCRRFLEEIDKGIFTKPPTFEEHWYWRRGYSLLTTVYHVTHGHWRALLNVSQVKMGSCVLFVCGHLRHHSFVQCIKYVWLSRLLLWYYYHNIGTNVTYWHLWQLTNCQFSVIGLMCIVHNIWNYLRWDGYACKYPVNIKIILVDHRSLIRIWENHFML